MLIMPALLALTASCGFTPQPLDMPPPPGSAQRPALSPMADEPAISEPARLALAADAAPPMTAKPEMPTQLAAAATGPMPLSPYTPAPPAEPVPPPAAAVAPPPPAPVAAAPGPAPPPPAAAAAPNPLDAIFGPPPAPAVVAPPPSPTPAAASGPDFSIPIPIPFGQFFNPGPGRLTLSNFAFDTAQIQAVITPYPDCLPHEGVLATDFILPLNGTRIINPPVGSDVCWRRAMGPGTRPGGAPGEPGWTEWNRDFTSTGAFIDARL